MINNILNFIPYYSIELDLVFYINFFIIIKKKYQKKRYRLK